MAISVRRAEANQADAAILSLLNADVQRVHADALPWRFKQPSTETFPPAAAAAILGNTDNLVFLAERDDAPAGYAYAEVVRLPESTMRPAYDMVYLHHISVRPEHRRQRVGEALLNAVRAAGKELGIELLALDVWSFNAAARAFFQRQGFTTYNERMWNK